MQLQHVCIGGLFFRISQAERFLLEGVLPDYDKFHHSCFSKCNTIDVPVNIFVNKKNSTPYKKPDFTDGQTRKIWVGNNEIFVRESPRAFDNHLWECRIMPQKPLVEVFCGKPLIKKNTRNPIVSNPFGYPIDYLAAMHILSFYEGIIVHAAGIVWQDYGFLFPGRSGTGKSTFSKHFRDRNDSLCLSDDRIIIRKTKQHKFFMVGTPWLGEAGLCFNEKVCLNFLVFIRKSSRIKIVPVQKENVLDRFLPALSIPWYDSSATTKMLKFCATILMAIPVFELYCPKKITNIDEIMKEIISYAS